MVLLHTVLRLSSKSRQLFLYYKFSHDTARKKEWGKTAPDTGYMIRGGKLEGDIMRALRLGFSTLFSLIDENMYPF